MQTNSRKLFVKYRTTKIVSFIIPPLASTLLIMDCIDPTCVESEEPPPLTSYKLACEADSDCTTVAIPNCGPCSCRETPLRAVDVDRFAEEQARCCDGSPDYDAICDACRDVVPLCSDGLCIAAERS